MDIVKTVGVRFELTVRFRKLLFLFLHQNGGGRIRTSDACEGIMVFKTIRFNRSRTPPFYCEMDSDGDSAGVEDFSSVSAGDGESADGVVAGVGREIPSAMRCSRGSTRIIWKSCA